MFNYEENPLMRGGLLDGSKSSESLQNLQKDSCVKITEHKDLKEITLPLKPKQLQELQKNDMYCRDIAKKLHKDVELQKIFIKENGVLYRLWIKDGRTFKCILVPQVLQDSTVILAHDYSGHNGSRRTYNCLKKQYYWPGIRKEVFRHSKKCAECIQWNSSAWIWLDQFTHLAVEVTSISYAYRDHIYCIFGGSSRILMDNGSDGQWI